MGNNRRTGHEAEREGGRKISFSFNLTWFDNRKVKVDEAEIGTARMFNPSLDARKIDLWISPMLKFLRRFAIQVKKHVIRSKTTNNIDVTSLFEMQPEREDDFRVLLTKLCYKPKVREMEKGWFVTMPYEDWARLTKIILQMKKERTVKETNERFKELLFSSLQLSIDSLYLFYEIRRNGGESHEEISNSWNENEEESLTWLMTKLKSRYEKQDNNKQ